MNCDLLADLIGIPIFNTYIPRVTLKFLGPKVIPSIKSFTSPDLEITNTYMFKVYNCSPSMSYRSKWFRIAF